jgi:hypothetical protein
MTVDTSLDEGVDLRRLGESAGGHDVLGDRFDGRPDVSGEKQWGPVARKRTRDGTTDGPPAP